MTLLTDDEQREIELRTIQRESHIVCGFEPIGDEPIPYTPDERRVVEYLDVITGIGGGADPIGFLIASHNYIRQQPKD